MLQSSDRPGAGEILVTIKVEPSGTFWASSIQRRSWSKNGGSFHIELLNTRWVFCDFFVRPSRLSGAITSAVEMP